MTTDDTDTTNAATTTMADGSTPIPSVKGVTVVFRRTIHSDCTMEFEQQLKNVINIVSQFEGHIGVEVIRPSGTLQQDWVVIFRFESERHLSRWEQSDERNVWLAKVEPMTEKLSVKKLTGLEFWFTLPDTAGRQPPPAWKMALVTTIGLYPLIYWLSPRLVLLFGDLPKPLATLLLVSVIVGNMTWIVMPTLIRFLGPWLFRKI